MRSRHGQVQNRLQSHNHPKARSIALKAMDGQHNRLRERDNLRTLTTAPKPTVLRQTNQPIENLNSKRKACLKGLTQQLKG